MDEVEHKEFLEHIDYVPTWFIDELVYEGVDVLSKGEVIIKESYYLLYF